MNNDLIIDTKQLEDDKVAVEVTTPESRIIDKIIINGENIKPDTIPLISVNLEITSDYLHPKLTVVYGISKNYREFHLIEKNKQKLSNE